MRSERLRAMDCPVARTVAEIGDAWRMLILRDALRGFRRFDEFQASLGIASNVLASRLDALVDSGYLTRERYSDRPPRYHYVPTSKSRDLSVVLAAMYTFGSKWLPPADKPMKRATGARGSRPSATSSR